ncbi:hypothetical protein H671_1g0341 [Cricetulus griseus]|nr:hypothetical protein H671_1g0341 [Cricetulus griseus]
MPAATRHGRRADRPPPELRTRHLRQARSPQLPGARSARASTPCTREGVCAACSWALGAGCRRQSGPSPAGAPRGQQKDDDEEGWAEKPLRSSPLPLPIPSLPLGGGKGRTRKKKKKKEEGGGVGELDIKIGWGGMVEDFWSPQQRLFLRRRRRRRQRQQEKERQP